MRKLLIILSLLLFVSFLSSGKQLTHKLKKVKTPPRIIRTCCSFGSDVGIMGIPFLKYTETTSIEKLGEHVYLGSKNEGNGIVYTYSGGFIDIGHLRDQADWTAFLFGIINLNKGKSIKMKLGREGGVKKLMLNIPENFSENDAILLAGRITYDLSVWHEITTWYGVSSVPLIPERYSAFSIEDDYSNLLGVTLGIEALKSDLPYEKAMTFVLKSKLNSLNVVDSENETLEAMEDVHNIWWTREKKLPSGNILMKRDISDYTGATPLLVPGLTQGVTPYKLHLELFSSTNESFTKFYQLEFKVNRKIPKRQIFPERKGRKISENDFENILIEVKDEVNQKHEIQKLKRQRKQDRKASRG